MNIRFLALVESQAEQQSLTLSGDIEIHMGTYIFKCRKVTIHE